ncbi:DUF4105 domain-containing protein [Fodinibius halophilus]|uniref:DUF4105 domain-containing protein n=1 Tax=Fodinibius halophilus TaxID=1736908 RepID=A0A6M1TMX0_9BACT|nr:DUF4105 domain-containing protein [Fodinibius halophilus]NGP89680.1 DUF4105 domain-containing protein [Fodinibius halophilus]
MIYITRRWILLLVSAFFLFPLFTHAQNKTVVSQSSSINEELEGNFDQLYLVFAGPYPASPSSTFGHLFLLVKSKENTSTNPQMWKAINFAADVEGHSGASTLYNGLVGNLDGSFEELPFYKKIRDYSYGESRDLWLFPLRLKPEEKKRFAKYLNQEQGSSKQYRFSDKNCATRISEVLHYTLGETYSKELFVLPQEVLSNDFIAPRLSDPLWIENIEGQLNDILSGYDSNGLTRTNIDSLSTEEKVHFLKTFEWLYNNKSDHIDTEKQELIRKLRYEVAQKETDYNFRSLKRVPFAIHPPGRVGIDYGYTHNGSSAMLVDLRLGLHSFTDSYNTYPKFDYIDVFRIRSMFSQTDILIDEFWLFQQLSRQPKNEFNSPLSWGLGLGGKRFTYKNESLMAMGLYAGVGKTFAMVKEYWATSFMLSFNPVFFEKEGGELIFNPKIENRFFPSQKVKGSFTVSNPIFLKSQTAFAPKFTLRGVYSITNSIQLASTIELQDMQLRAFVGIYVNLSL